MIVGRSGARGLDEVFPQVNISLSFLSYLIQVDTYASPSASRLVVGNKSDMRQHQILQSEMDNNCISPSSFPGSSPPHDLDSLAHLSPIPREGHAILSSSAPNRDLDTSISTEGLGIDKNNPSHFHTAPFHKTEVYRVGRTGAQGQAQAETEEEEKEVDTKTATRLAASLGLQVRECVSA